MPIIPAFTRLAKCLVKTSERYDGEHLIYISLSLTVVRIDSAVSFQNHSRFKVHHPNTDRRLKAPVCGPVYVS